MKKTYILIPVLIIVGISAVMIIQLLPVSQLIGLSKTFTDSSQTFTFSYPSSWIMKNNPTPQYTFSGTMAESYILVPKNGGSTGSIIFEVFTSSSEGKLKDYIPECSDGVRCRTIASSSYEAVLFTTDSEDGNISHSYMQKGETIMGIHKSSFKNEKQKEESEEIIRSFTTL